MTRLAGIAVALFTCVVDPALAQTPARVPLVGYVDRTGRVVEPARFEGGSMMFRGDWVAVFGGGKAGYLNLRTRAGTGLVFDGVADDYERVLFAHGPEPVKVAGKWGFADERGAIVISPSFDGARGFDAEGLALVEVADAGGYPRRQGFIDRSGRVVVQPRYDQLWRYSGERAVFRQGERFGALDRGGREVIPPRFGWLGWFAENGLAPATVSGGLLKEGSRFGYVDRTGAFVIPEQFGSAGSFRPTPDDGGQAAPPGLARVGLASGETAYIDAAGAVVTRFPAGLGVSGVSPNGLVRFQEKGKYGFLDRSGAVVIPPRFDQANGFDAAGLAAVQEGGKAGYIRADGAWAIEPRFTNTGDFNDAFGQAPAAEGGRSVLIDRGGRTVTTFAQPVSFHHQHSEYAAFKVYPPQIDFPPEPFGRWRLERTLFAVPEVPALHGPDPTGVIRLTFQTDDGLVRWRIETVGGGFSVLTDQGPRSDGYDVGSRTELGTLPQSGTALINVLKRQLEGGADVTITTTLPGDADAAAQRRRRRQIIAARPAHLAELAASTPDLDRALAALNVRSQAQFGR